MKTIILSIALALSVVGSIVLAGPTPGSGGIPYVTHGESLSGSGTVASGLRANLTPNGGIEMVPDAGIRIVTGITSLVSGSAGLSVSQVTSTGGYTVNLTTEGTTDWIAAENGVNYVNRKITGSGALRLPVTIASGNAASTVISGNCGATCADSISWTASDATTVRASPGTVNPQFLGVYCLGACIGIGMMWVVDAKPSQQVLRQYIDFSGGGVSTMACTGIMTDGSGTVTTSSVTPGATELFAKLTWTFTGANADTKLIIHCRSLTSADGIHLVGMPWLAMTLAPT